jgi:haloalkane dehalogenase
MESGVVDCDHKVAAEPSCFRPFLFAGTRLIVAQIKFRPKGEMMISSDERYEKKRVNVLGHELAYVDEGSGETILFLHGNPTSSYLWRNIIPHCVDLGRCIAPDLLGMGDSQKLADSGPGSYRFVEHAAHLDALFDTLEIGDNVVIVCHDWGSALGFHWAFRNQPRVKGIAYMEALVQTLTWDEWPEQSKPIFQSFRSEAGDKLVLEKNIFVERVLPGSVLHDLSEDEMAVYRRPYLEAGESRRPTLTWPRELPIDGEPADVNAIVADYMAWLPGSDIQKLFVNADPGAIITGGVREFCRTFANQQEITVKGVHFIQEDAPDEIGTAVAEFIRDIRK